MGSVKIRITEQSETYKSSIQDFSGLMSYKVKSCPYLVIFRKNFRKAAEFVQKNSVDELYVPGCTCLRTMKYE